MCYLNDQLKAFELFSKNNNSILTHIILINLKAEIKGG